MNARHRMPPGSVNLKRRLHEPEEGQLAPVELRLFLVNRSTKIAGGNYPLSLEKFNAAASFNREVLARDIVSDGRIATSWIRVRSSKFGRAAKC